MSKNRGPDSSSRGEIRERERERLCVCAYMRRRKIEGEKDLGNKEIGERGCGEERKRGVWEMVIITRN